MGQCEDDIKIVPFPVVLLNLVFLVQISTDTTSANLNANILYACTRPSTLTTPVSSYLYIILTDLT